MSIDSVMRFDADHPVFPGHFPGNPIVPGVLLLARVLDAIDAIDAIEPVVAAGAPGTLETPATPATPGAPGAPASDAGYRIRSVKFHSPALPGQRLDLDLKPGPHGQYGFVITEGARRIASGTIEIAR